MLSGPITKSPLPKRIKLIKRILGKKFQTRWEMKEDIRIADLVMQSMRQDMEEVILRPNSMRAHLVKGRFQMKHDFEEVMMMGTISYPLTPDDCFEKPEHAES